MKVAMVGSEYVGLVPGMGFAGVAHDVAGIGKSTSRIEPRNAGGMSIVEPGLTDAATGLIFNPNCDTHA